MRVRPSGARSTTHYSAAAVDSALPSYHSRACGGLATPGRRQDDEPLFQVKEWLIRSELQSDRKGAQSLQQRWNGEWSVWPQGAGPRYLHLWGDIRI